MAIVQFPGGLIVPPTWPFNVANPNLAGQTIDASGEKTGFTFTIPKTGALNRIQFLTGAVSLNAASKLKVSFQNLDSNGDPDGTVDQYRLIDAADVGANSWITPGLMTDDGSDTGAKRSVARGDRVAGVIEYDTFNSLDSVEINAVGGSATAGWSSPSYRNLYTVSWAKTEGPMPILALEYDDGTYEQIIGCYPVKSIVTDTYNSSSTPDERGLIFTVPAPLLIGGAIIRMSAAVNLSVPIVLYAPDGITELLNITLSGFANSNSRHFNIRFPSDVRLEANEFYRLTVKPSSATNVSLYSFTTDSESLMGVIEGGTSWFYCERTDSGNWTDVTTKRPWISLWVTGIDHDISGGSGGSGSGGIG